MGFVLFRGEFFHDRDYVFDGLDYIFKIKVVGSIFKIKILKSTHALHDQRNFSINLSFLSSVYQPLLKIKILFLRSRTFSFSPKLLSISRADFPKDQAQAPFPRSKKITSKARDNPQKAPLHFKKIHNHPPPTFYQIDKTSYKNENQNQTL